MTLWQRQAKKTLWEHDADTFVSNSAPSPSPLKSEKKSFQFCAEGQRHHLKKVLYSIFSEWGHSPQLSEVAGTSIPGIKIEDLEYSHDLRSSDPPSVCAELFTCLFTFCTGFFQTLDSALAFEYLKAIWHGL